MVELLIVLILILGLLNLCADIIILRTMVDDYNDAFNIENEEKGGLFNMQWGVRRNASKEEIEKAKAELNKTYGIKSADEIDKRDVLYLAFVRKKIHALDSDKNFGRISEAEYEKQLAEIANDISDLEKKYCIA